MRILVVATQIRLPDTHGGSTHVGELVSHLRAHGQVMVLARRGSTAEDAVGISFDMGHPPVIKHVMPALYFPRAWRAARRFGPDVIYERASSYGLGAMLSRALDVPMLCMVLDEHHSPLSLRRAGRIVATDPAIVPARARHKAVKVSWGANEERFDPSVSGDAARARYGLSGTVLAYVGSFKAWHGLDHLVEATKRLAGREVTVLMVGDGPERARVESLVDQAGLAGRFVFTGAVAYPEVPGLIAASDLCVAPFEPDRHPRSAQGFVLDPLKVFEYLAMAKPTITVDSANLRALFEDHAQLVLVPPGDSEALAEAMEELLDDPERARAMAERGRARVLERHTWRSHADHLHRLFLELLEERS